MDQSARQHTNRGFSDAAARGFEIALVPVLFGALGWWLDSIFSTGRTLTLALAVFGVVGMGIKLWLQYDAEMTRHESDHIWARAHRPTTAGQVQPRDGRP